METYTRKQAAEKLHISERTLDRYIKAGKLEVSKAGDTKTSKVFITDAAINEFLQTHKKTNM